MSLHQRSSTNFTNPFQGRQRNHPYQQEDLNASDRDMQNVQENDPPQVTEPDVDPVRGDAVIDFQAAYTDNTLNPQTNVTAMDLETNMTQMDNTNLRPPEPFDTATDQKLLEKAIKNTLFDIVQWNAIGLIFFGMLSMTVKIGVSYLYVFVFLWIHNTYNIVMLSNRNSHPTDKGKVTFGVVNNLLSAIFKVFLVIQIETRALLFSVPLAPILVFELLSSIVRVYYNKKYTVLIVYKIRLLFKFMVALQILLICLKLDNIVKFEWREVFWVYWISVAITVGITFALVLMSLNKCCSYMFAEMERVEVRGVFWILLVIGGATALSFAFVIKLLKVLDHNLNQSLLAPVLITATIYCFFVASYTLIYRKQLIEFFNRIAAVDVNSPISEEDQQQEEKQKATAPAEPEKVDIPKFLTKSSSTYFRRATGDEVEVAKTKRKQKEEKKAAAKQKQDARNGVKLSKRRQNSMDQLKLRNMSQIGNTSTSPLNLLTVPETDAERTRTNIDNSSNTSRFGLRTDKGKDLLSSMTDRNGVSGIIPSGLITSKTDRFYNSAREGHHMERDKDYSPLTSNDSYLLAQMSKDTDGQFSAFRKPEKNPDMFRNSPTFNLPTTDASPHLRNPDASPLANMDVSPLKIPDRRGDEEGLELPTFNKNHRRINSMQNISANKMFSLFEAIESPKVRDSVRIEFDPPIISPKSDASQAVQCLICFDNPPDAVFMECGHGGVCYECSLEIWKATNECYLCRNKITQVLQIDLKAKVGDDVIKVLSSTQMVLYEEEAAEA